MGKKSKKKSKAHSNVLTQGLLDDALNSDVVEEPRRKASLRKLSNDDVDVEQANNDADSDNEFLRRFSYTDDDPLDELILFSDPSTSTLLDNNLEITDTLPPSDPSVLFGQSHAPGGREQQKRRRKRVLTFVSVIGGCIATTVTLYLLFFQKKHFNITDTEAFDFMVQDVCVNDGGKWVDPYNCRSGVVRNLEIGESLPYVNHDYDPNTKLMYQISNSLPMRDTSNPTKIRILQTMDYPNKDGSPIHPKNITYFQFDEGYDGYNANSVFGDTDDDSFVSIVGTADPSGDVQLFVAPDGTSKCKLTNSWGLFGKGEKAGTGNGLEKGEHTFQLNIVKTKLRVEAVNPNYACPGAYVASEGKQDGERSDECLLRHIASLLVVSLSVTVIALL